MPNTRWGFLKKEDPFRHHGLLLEHDHYLLCNTSGYGEPLRDVPPEKFNRTAVPKSYQSPWEQALIKDPMLADTLISCMPGPEPPPGLPGYKSFNR